MDVLRFECEDYSVTISTATIESAWERFERRVTDEAWDYCGYKSEHEGQLSLIFPKQWKNGLQMLNPEVMQTEWKERHPVMFETCEYQFAVQFNHLMDTANEKHRPKVRHMMKSVVDNFNFYPSGKNSGILVGSVNFLNSPGKFCFAFEYKSESGDVCSQQMELYVASPKLDTKNNLKQIIALINQEYENYVFDYLTLTFSSFALKRSEKNNSIIWLSIFQSVADEYFKSVRYVMSRPNNKSVRKIYHARPERIRRWNQQEEERYLNLGRDAEHHYFRYEQIENTTNTRENRFVKYSLHILRKKFREVFGEVGRLYKDMDSNERKRIFEYNKEFRRLESASFFQKVGNFEGFRQESAILQQRNGYSQIYKAWLMLKNSLDLIDGKTAIGMKKIWELYEIWCFLVMKRLIAKVLGLDLNDSAHIRESKGQIISTIVKSEMTHVVEFDNLSNGDLVKLEYQHTYNRSSKEFKSTTTEQRPDIVLTIRKPNGFVLTYLYDAKYRVQDDVKDGELDEGVDIDLADYPLPDAINQMHRYRDAIYYSMNADERPKGKEVIGGYILFPGRTEGNAIENRYFFKSIKKVNIGAFPLLPANEAQKDNVVLCDLLERHLHEILLDNTAYEQIKDSIPQKGLYYTNEFDDLEDIVVIGLCKNEEQIQWIAENRWYNVPLAKVNETPLMIKAKYILLHKSNESVSSCLFQIERGKYEVWTKDKLLHGEACEPYPYEPSSEAYFMFKLRNPSKLPDSLVGKRFKFGDARYISSNHKQPIAFVKLNDLLDTMVK